LPRSSDVGVPPSPCNATIKGAFVSREQVLAHLHARIDRDGSAAWSLRRRLLRDRNRRVCQDELEARRQDSNACEAHEG
jgi:hypothetical protein